MGYTHLRQLYMIIESTIQKRTGIKTDTCIQFLNIHVKILSLKHHKILTLQVNSKNILKF